MKKLIATAVVAAAAYGAFAIETGVRFENLERGATSVEALNTAANEVHNTENFTYWSGDVANTYTVYDWTADKHDSYAHPDAFANDQYSSTNALSIKTTFGKPLSFAVNGDGTDGNMGIYFDSLVKFTVCEEAPETDYPGAKIALWLQEEYDEDDNIIGTNLMVRAGFLSIGENGVEVSNAVYKAGNSQIKDDGAFADKWHRVTIKTIADITEDGDSVRVPGFVIYIDGNLTEAITIAATDQPKWDESFTYARNEIAENLNDSGYLFPSMVQGLDTKKDALTGVQFDGTGSINELVFTETDPEFAKDEKYMDPKFSLQLGESELGPFTTVADAIDAINKLDVAGEYTLKLLENLNISESLVFDNADESITIVLDLNGKTIINTVADTTYAITVTGGTTLTITDSSANKDGMIVSVTEEELGAILLGQDAVFTLAAGTINGYINGDAASTRYTGGSVDAATKDNAYNEATDYKFVRNEETGFWDVVPLESFTVTFKVDDEVVYTTNVVEGTKVADIVPAAPTKTGYDFNGWAIPENAVVEGAVTYTAQWEIITYTVTYVLVADSEAGVAPAKGSYTVESGTVTLTQPAAVTGYTFSGWYAAQELTDDVVTQFTVDTANPANKTFYGKFTATPYTITYVLNGGNALEGDYATSYTITSKPITLPTTATRNGYEFAGWTNAVGDVVATFTVDPENLGDVTFYAKWTENTPAEPETPVIPEGDTSVEVEGEANAEPEVIAGKVTLEVTAEVKAALGTGEGAVSEETYQGYFTKKAVYDQDKAKWTVTAEIAEEVQEAVAESAVEALSVAEPTVSIPRGLYYKITTMTSLEGEGAQSVKGISNGAGISVTKPGQKKGFIKVQIGTQAYAE